MALTLRLSDPTQIAFVNAVVHDAWFEIEDVALDRAAAALRVPFQREMIERREWLTHGWMRRVGRVPVVRGVLHIEQATEFTLRDTEGIGMYQMNELTYDPREKRVRITTSIPLWFVVSVGAFSIVVEQTDEVIGEKTVHWFLGCESSR